MRVHILQNFSDDKSSLGVPTPQPLVIMQYGWGIASNRLQREAMGLPGFEVKVDNDGEVIDVLNLYFMYTCLLQHSKDYLTKETIAKPTQVMILKFNLFEAAKENYIQQHAKLLNTRNQA